MSGVPRAARAAVAERRRRAIELRLAGLDLVSIGHALSAHRENPETGKPTPYGYGYERTRELDDESLKATVSADIRRTIDDRRTDAANAAEHLKDLHNERLERLLQRVWAKALGGDNTAVKNALSILERQARLNGIDGPIRIAQEGDVDNDVRDTVRELLRLADGLPLRSDPSRTEGAAQ